MCKKLFVLLVVVALSVPAMAAAISGTNPWASDIEGNNGPGGQPVPNTQPGWKSWNFGTTGSFTNGDAVATTKFATGGNINSWPTATLTVTKWDGTLGGGVRNRGAGWPAGQLGQMHADIAYVAQSGGQTAGLGTNFLTLALTKMGANKTYQIRIWNYDPAFKAYPDTVPGYGGAGEPCDSKWGAWSTQNPAAWLAANDWKGKALKPDLTWDGNGYQVPDTGNDSNMPAGLAATLLGRALEQGQQPWVVGSRYVYSSVGTVTSNENGEIFLYGWNDMTSFGGSQHMAINGFYLVPEPATVALLGLGGLALLRRKRA
jgi:hypothetical protein